MNRINACSVVIKSNEYKKLCNSMKVAYLILRKWNGNKIESLVQNRIKLSRNNYIK